MEIINEPLIIVPDDDDDDYDDDVERFKCFDLTATIDSNSMIVNHVEEQTIVSNEITEQDKQADIEIETVPVVESNTKSSIIYSSSKSSSIRPIVIDTSFNQQQQRRTKSKLKKKISNSKNLSPTSALSFISFDDISNIITVSRVGSIYYCMEDLYIKIFSSLCTFEEFSSLLLKPEQIILKQVTLSEKLALTEKNSLLKQYNQTRYRLISIDSFDYLIKLKQLLLNHKNNQIETIIDEMRSYKQTSTSILLQNKTATKRLKNQQTQDGIFIQCNNPVNDNDKLTKLPLKQSYRSKSLVDNSQSIQEDKTRSYSLPSIKFNIKEESMLKFQTKPYQIIEDNYPMPTIVNIEENVPINTQRVFNPPPYPRVSRSVSLVQPPVHTPYTIYYHESQQQQQQQPIREINSNYQNLKTRSPIMTSMLEKPMHHHTQISKDIISNERMIYPTYTSSNPKSPSSMNLKQHRASLNPYTSPKIYLAPLSNPYPCPSKSLPTKTNLHPSRSSPALIQNSSPMNNLELPYVCTQSISFSQAIIEHNRCNIDLIPKLVVKHSKTFLNKTIDTMGQLFPTWFNQPDYRCIHCFTCDQVFTPQAFMTHVDDPLLINEQPVNMTSIQLLTSEKMSEYKVDLWNQFCTNLTIYAREGRIVGFTTNRYC